MSNKRGGKRYKRGKKRRVKKSKADTIIANRHGECQVYARVTSKPGGTRLLVECSDGKTRSAYIPGKFRRGRGGVWMKIGDILLCNIESMGKTSKSCFIELKYDTEEGRDGEIKYLKANDPIFKEFYENKNKDNVIESEIIFTNDDKKESVYNDDEYDEIVIPQKKTIDNKKMDNDDDDFFDW
jgi:initiation factor 1A